MTRLLMITPARPAGAVGGREQLSALHERCLSELLGDGFAVHRLEPSPPTGIRGTVAALGGAIDGVTTASVHAIRRRIAEEGIDELWLDGSNLGRLAVAVKRAAPGVTVTTFAHNVEARFFLGGLRHRPGPHALAVLFANWAAERLAVRHSDRLIALSERDSTLFGRLYRRSASDLLPMAIDDAGAVPDRGAASRDGLLFVGGAFYANLAGMRWFAEEVAPRLAMQTKVVGRGFEAYREELEASGAIKVVGGVYDLAPYYRDALAVIAPIFDGSGMKTKVAEALMHGKPVIGTAEAFTGYEGLDAGIRCDTSEAFIAAIRGLETDPPARFDPALRALYEAHYSPQALGRQLNAILGVCPPPRTRTAMPLSSRPSPVGGNIDPKTVAGFGEEWAAFDQRALDAAEWQRLFNAYFSTFPFDLLPVGAEGFDLGCGSGRWAAGVAPRVGKLHCIDPSAKALNVARKALAAFPNVDFHLAGADSVPLANSSQDFGYSLGVLHHSPDTRAALQSCVDKLKPGAPFLLYLYYALDNRSAWFRALWSASNQLRKVISRLPFGPRKLITSAIAATVYLPLATIARAGEKAGFDVARLPLSFYRNASFYTMRTDALDRFGTRLEHRFTRSQIAAMMTACGLTDIVFLDGEPYWVACGIKA